jgi:hypothetical protein
MERTWRDRLRDFVLGPEFEEVEEESIVVTAPAVIHHMNQAVKPWLSYVGKHQVIKDPKPHYNAPVVLSAPRTGVLHTTEGGWAGSEAVFKRHFSPHFMLGILDGVPRIEQYVPVGTIGASMKAHNDLAIVQVECIGFSEETSWQFQPRVVDLIASLMMVCEAEYGIPLSRPWPDGVYGRARASDPHRHEGKFGSVAGWYGHGDVPDNDHWDPGNLQWQGLFDRAEILKTEGIA